MKERMPGLLQVQAGQGKMILTFQTKIPLFLRYYTLKSIVCIQESQTNWMPGPPYTKIQVFYGGVLDIIHPHETWSPMLAAFAVILPEDSPTIVAV